MYAASLDLMNIYIFCEEKKFKALLIFVKHPYLYCRDKGLKYGYRAVGRV